MARPARRLGHGIPDGCACVDGVPEHVSRLLEAAHTLEQELIPLLHACDRTRVDVARAAHNIDLGDPESRRALHAHDRGLLPRARGRRSSVVGRYRDGGLADGWASDQGDRPPRFRARAGLFQVQFDTGRRKKR